MIAQRVKLLNPSVTLSLSEKAKELKDRGNDVISLSVGEPDFPTPLYIKEAGKRAIDENKTKYTPVAGIPELKNALIDAYEREQGYRFDPKEIIVHPGSKYSIFLAALTLVEPGERVIIPTPYWVSYPEIIRFAGGEPVFVPYWDKGSFDLRYDLFEEEIKKGVKLIILNVPSNPTGVIMQEKELVKLLEASLKYNFYILLDECYRRMLYDGHTFPSPLKLFPEAKSRLIVSGSFSKSYSMTGWRVGFTFAPAEIVKYMNRLQGHSTSNPPSMAQYAAVTALKEEKEEVNDMVREYQRRRDICLQLLDEIPGVETTKPHGAFYLYPCVEKALKGKYSSTEEFAKALLETRFVSLVPGEAFGTPGFLRISYAASEKNLREGIARMREALR